MNNVFDVVIIGGGPSGMMAGISAKDKKNKVFLVLSRISTALMHKHHYRIKH